MVDLSNEWRNLRNLEVAKRKILDSNQPFAPSPQLEGLPLRGCKTILDFGCGVGRNIPSLLRLAPDARIIGYDLPNLVELANVYLGPEVFKKIEWLNPPPTALRIHTYDFVVADISFQHLDESELRLVLTILKDRLQPNGKLWVAGRWWSDYKHKSVWEMVLDYFDPVTPLKLDEAVGDNHQQVLFRPNPMNMQSK